jgi:hypothetical protein
MPCSISTKGAVVGEIGDLAEKAGRRRVTARDADPGIFAQLLETERNAVLFLVELEDLGLDFVANRQHLGGVTNAAPCQIGDVQQAIDATEVDEGTVIGDVLDHALDDAAFLEGRQQRIALFANAGFENGTARNNHVVALAVELDDLEFVGLAFVRRGVLDRTHVDQRTRQEGADAVGHYRQPPLDLAGDRAGDQRTVVQRLLERIPRSDPFGTVARQAGFTETVLELLDGDLDEITDLDFEFALVAQEFFNFNVALGLETGIDHHKVLVDAHDFRSDDLSRTHFLTSEALFEKFGKAFLHGGIG